MVTEQERQAIVDETSLDLLPIAYWVSAGFWGFYALFMVAYFVLIGTLFVSIPPDGSGAPPEFFGWVFLGVGLCFFVLAAATVTLKVLAGFWIRKRKHRVATMIVAAITCLEIPYGTLIGVLTFIAFSRPSVKALYEGVAPYGSVDVAPPPPEPGSVVDETPSGQ